MKTSNFIEYNNLLKILNPQAINIFNYLIQNMNFKTNIINISQKQISHYLKIENSKTSTYIKRLCQIIKIYKKIIQ